MGARVGIRAPLAHHIVALAGVVGVWCVGQCVALRQLGFCNLPPIHEAHLKHIMKHKTKQVRATSALTCVFTGGGEGSRTPDTGIFSPLLYQLSYPAKGLLLQARLLYQTARKGQRQSLQCRENHRPDRPRPTECRGCHAQQKRLSRISPFLKTAASQLGKRPSRLIKSDILREEIGLGEGEGPLTRRKRPRRREGNAAAASFWRQKARSHCKCVRNPCCGAVLAPQGAFPQQLRTKPPLWRRP